MVRVGIIEGVACLLVARGVDDIVWTTLLDRETILVCDSVLPVVTVIEPRLLILSEILALPVNMAVAEEDWTCEKLPKDGVRIPLCEAYVRVTNDE